MNRKFYAISAFTHGCISGGHTANDYDIVWWRGVQDRWVGEQSCPDCDATRRVLEYAKPKRKARA